MEIEYYWRTMELSLEVSYSGEYETVTITYDSSSIQTQAVRFDQESKSLGLITEVK